MGTATVSVTTTDTEAAALVAEADALNVNPYLLAYAKVTQAPSVAAVWLRDRSAARFMGWNGRMWRATEARMGWEPHRHHGADRGFMAHCQTLALAVIEAEEASTVFA